MNVNAILENAWLVGLFIIIGLLGSLGLLALGMNMWRREQGKEAAPTPAAGEPPAAAPKPAGFQFQLPAALTDRLTPRPAAPPDANAVEVLRVLRHRLTGRVLVELAGQRFASLGEIPEADLRRAVEVTLRDLHEFAGSPAPVASAAPPLPPPAPAPDPAPLAAPPASPAPAVHPAYLAQEVAQSGDEAAILRLLNPAPIPRSAALANTPLRMPSMNIFKQMSVAREVSAKELAPIQTVAEQIDEVLQHITIGTPFALQNLRVASGPTGNVVFRAGDQSYDGVDSLPEGPVKVVFKEAIRRWEQQQ